jgi:hypothetical protein
MVRVFLGLAAMPSLVRDRVSWRFSHVLAFPLATPTWA